MYQTIGFIGTGNMGSAVAQAAAHSGLAARLLLANRTPEKARDLAARLEGGVASTNEEVARESQLVFLGVKPQMMEDMLAQISPVLKGRTDRYILVTMAASLTCLRIREMAGVDCPVIRMMPNTPSAVGEGVIFYDLKRLNIGMHNGDTGTNAPPMAQLSTDGRAPWWNCVFPLNAVQQNKALAGKNNPNPTQTVKSVK